MPTARSVLSASTVDGKIYAIGGHGGRRVVEEYDPVIDAWTAKAFLPTWRQWLSTSVVDGKIYAIGGDAYDGQPSLSTVEVYDPTTDTWTEKAPMLIPRFGLSTSVVNGKIYAIGGWLRPPERVISDVEEYDPATDTWTEKAPMPTARAAFSTSVVDGKIYAIGGVPRNGAAPFSTVEMYDPATDSWTTKAPMPTARAVFLSASVVNGIIYVIGGISSGEPAFSTVEAYDPATDTWTEKTPMPRARGMFATSVVGRKIYAIGGRRTAHGANISTVEEYDTGLGVPSPDFDSDGAVDIKDLLRLIDSWGLDNPMVDIAPPPFGDGVVDGLDLEFLMSYWEQPVDDPTLVAHWALDETGADVAYDSAGANDGFVIGGPIWHPVGGQLNGAIELDGIDDVVVAGAPLNPADGPFSVLAWVNGGAPGQAIISEPGGPDWLMLDPLSGHLATELTNAGRSAAPLASQTAIQDGNWHRIGLAWDGSYRMLYVDGVVVAEDVQDGLVNKGNGFYIGCGKDMQSGTYFSGLIDDVRIYSRAVHP
jgi:N-acetylneuraminic acid mutarotase